MPSELVITVYTIDELEGKSRQRALDRIQQALHETFESDMITEAFADVLKEKCLPYDDIRWSLSSSQGDGVAFYGDVDLECWVKKNSSLLRDPSTILTMIAEGLIYAKISKRSAFHMYDHANTMELEIIAIGLDPVEGPKHTRDIVDNLKDQLQRDIIDTSRLLEKIGYKEIEYQTSEEEALNTARDREMQFTKDGKQV